LTVLILQEEGITGIIATKTCETGNGKLGRQSGKQQQQVQLTIAKQQVMTRESLKTSFTRPSKKWAAKG
jgi:hypothetical protein